jgi:hypothetical protein
LPVGSQGGLAEGVTHHSLNNAVGYAEFIIGRAFARPVG